MFTQNHFVARITTRLLIVCSLVAVYAAIPVTPTFAASSGLIISEYLANPAGNDSPFEYVELVATESIDFAVTPYSVVFTNNGTTTPPTTAGWIAGGNVTYGFNITEGSVSAGEVVYVGGSSMPRAGKKLRVINTATTGGDRFGNPQLTGVLGNGGQQADGIGVFAADINTLDSTTVPIDAIFFGTATGQTSYELPINDRYSGGKFQAGSFLATDPGSTQVVVATGEYDVKSGGFTTPRSWAVGPGTDGTSAVTVVLPPINQPTTLSCPSALFTAPETSTSATITASDPDAIVGAPQLISGAVAGITLTNAVGATGAGGTASATLNLSAATAPGIYNVIIRVSNDETPAEVKECTIAVGFVVANERVYLPIVLNPAVE